MRTVMQLHCVFLCLLYVPSIRELAQYILWCTAHSFNIYNHTIPSTLCKYATDHNTFIL